MSSSNNTSFVHYETNRMSESDWIKYSEFLDQRKLARIILYILISILIVLGNTLVLLVTWRERSLHQPNKCFIACLAVADLLVGVFIGPVVAYELSLDSGSRINIHLCRFMVWMDTLALTASICSLIFISYDRYLKISKPLQYRSRMTTSKSLKIIFIIWLISVTFASYAVSPISGSDGFLAHFGSRCPVDYRKKKVLDTFAITVLFLAAIVMLVMYGCIFVVARKRQRMLRNGELGETSTGQNQRSVLRQHLKIVTMLMIVVGVFWFCWLPICVWTLLDWYHRNLFDWNNLSISAYSRLLVFDSLVRLLAMCNSMCNPIIYACLDQTYREAFKHLFQKMCRTRSNTQQQPAVIELRPMRNS